MRRSLLVLAVGVAVLVPVTLTGASAIGRSKPPRATTTTTRNSASTTTTRPPATTTTTSPATTTTTPVMTTIPVTTTATSPATTAAPAGSCPMFPADNPWNTDISAASVLPNSASYVTNILANGGGFLHADFGGGGAYGIPYVTVGASTPMVPVNFTAYGDESDPGPYPIPLDAPIEGGAASDGDRHVLALDPSRCKLYELYRAFPNGSSWNADSGAVFDLRSNALRPEGWTSADAAGLPVLPGLARYDEVAAGVIRHALRFTVNATQRAYIHPATHFASSSTDPNRPPMGLRMRLKASFDTSGYTGQARVILEALKRYGMILADNGSNWFITGAADPRWNDTDLDQLKKVPGSAFEAVDTGPLVKG